MIGLKKKGIDLDGDNEKKEKRTTTIFESQTYSRPIETPTHDSEVSFGLSRQRVLKREV